MKMGVSGGWGVRTGSHDPGREGCGWFGVGAVIWTWG